MVAGSWLGVRLLLLKGWIALASLVSVSGYVVHCRKPAIR